MTKTKDAQSMLSLMIRTEDGVFEAKVRELVEETLEANAYVVEVDDVGAFAAIVYHDGEIITSRDWQGTCYHIDPEDVREAMSNPIWAHHWMRARDYADCVIIAGLPRVIG